MATDSEHNACLDFRLPAELGEVVEAAASALGLSVDDFVITTLAQRARSIVHREAVTELTDRDRDRLLALLDDGDAGPNPALAGAAEGYKKHLG